MSIESGGAGSGYIGNTLVSNKKMVGYNVPTSEVESTKTESVNEASESPVSGKPKIGNGYARIKFLRDLIEQTAFNLTASSSMADSDGTQMQVMEGGGTYSDENGYYCTSNSRLRWEKQISSDILKGNGCIDFDVKGINNNGSGSNYEFQIVLRRVSNNNMVLSFIVANGYDDASSAREVLLARDDALNLHYIRDNEGSILDVNKNAWHDTKLRIYLENSSISKTELYLDNVLWKTYTDELNCSFANWNENFRVEVYFIDKTGVKSASVSRYR